MEIVVFGGLCFWILLDILCNLSSQYNIFSCENKRCEECSNKTL